MFQSILVLAILGAPAENYKSVEMKMTDEASVEFVQLLARDHASLGAWGEQIASAHYLTPMVLRSAKCVARINRPVGDYALTAEDRALNRIECSFVINESTRTTINFSMAEMRLERWGTHFDDNEFSVYGIYAQLLFPLFVKATRADEKKVGDKMFSDYFECDPKGASCLDGYALHQKPFKDLEHITVDQVACDRDTDFTDATKKDILAHFKVYVEAMRAGGDGAQAAEKEYFAFLSKIYGDKEGFEMLEDQLARGVREVTSLSCTWIDR
jgi:hypothetical protein